MRKRDWFVCALILLYLVAIVWVAAAGLVAAQERSIEATPAMETTVTAGAPDTAEESIEMTGTDPVDAGPTEADMEKTVAERPDELAETADYAAALELALLEANDRLETAGLEAVTPPDPAEYLDGGEW